MREAQELGDGHVSLRLGTHTCPSQFALGCPLLYFERK